VSLDPVDIPKWQLVTQKDLEPIISELGVPLTFAMSAAVNAPDNVGTPNIAEIGSNKTVTLTLALSKDPETLSIDQDIGSLAVTARTATKSSVTGNLTFTGTANNGFRNYTAAASVAFKRKRYWGGTAKADGTSLTRAEILAAEAAGRWEWVDGRSMGQKSFTLSNEYGWVAEPASLGVSPSFIFDGVAVVDAPAPDTFANFENTSGGVADYQVYRTGVRYTGTYGIAKP